MGENGIETRTIIFHLLVKEDFKSPIAIHQGHQVAAGLHLHKAIIELIQNLREELRAKSFHLGRLDGHALPK